jgi:hypothetical protein
MGNITFLKKTGHDFTWAFCSEVGGNSLVLLFLMVGFTLQLQAIFLSFYAKLIKLFNLPLHYGCWADLRKKLLQTGE